ncbi:substrate-binding domain-containing protein [Mariniluteicoccus flavus]
MADGTLAGAVAFGNDAMALGALTVFAREGIRVPDDVSILGFDGIAMGRFAVPTLATIACDYVELGQECTSLLLERAAGAAVERRVLEARWVPGASVSAPAGATA